MEILEVLADILYNTFAEGVFAMPGSISAQYTGYTGASAGAFFMSLIVLISGAIAIFAGGIGALARGFKIFTLLDLFDKVGGLGGDDGGGMGGGFGGNDSAQTIFHTARSNFWQIIMVGAVLVSVNGIFGYLLNLAFRLLFVVGASVMNPNGGYSIMG